MRQVRSRCHLLWTTRKTYPFNQCREKGASVPGSTGISSQWHCDEENNSVHLVILCLVYTSTCSFVYVTDPYKIEYSDMLNTIKLNPSKLKSKQSVPDELAKHNMPATRSIASLQTSLSNTLTQKRIN